MRRIQSADESRLLGSMCYGKGDVLVYRTYAKPLKVDPIPESAFVGTDNVIFALNVTVAVTGESFLPSFTEGDNRMIVATDSMKNFILRHTAEFTGNTIESFLHFIGCAFLNRYAHITRIELSAQRLPFESVGVPFGDGQFVNGGLVYRSSHNDKAECAVQLERGADDIAQVACHTSSIIDIQLIKVSGSSFAHFIRDEYTTLPESFDRPLFIYLNIDWTYGDFTSALEGKAKSYVAAEQIRDIAQTVFHEVNSVSIQNLIYRIGMRILERYPQLASVSFESNNRTWETVIETVPGSSGKVYTEARPPFGFQRFTMTQEDLQRAVGEMESAGEDVL